MARHLSYRHERSASRQIDGERRKEELGRDIREPVSGTGWSLFPLYPSYFFLYPFFVAGEPMAERVATATDPLNLMRIMPPQGAMVEISAMRFPAHGFFV